MVSPTTPRAFHREQHGQGRTFADIAVWVWEIYGGRHYMVELVTPDHTHRVTVHRFGDVGPLLRLARDEAKALVKED